MVPDNVLLHELVFWIIRIFQSYTSVELGHHRDCPKSFISRNGGTAKALTSQNIYVPTVNR